MSIYSVHCCKYRYSQTPLRPLVDPSLDPSLAHCTPTGPLWTLMRNLNISLASNKHHVYRCFDTQATEDLCNMTSSIFVGDGPHVLPLFPAFIPQKTLFWLLESLHIRFLCTPKLSVHYITISQIQRIYRTYTRNVYTEAYCVRIRT